MNSRKLRTLATLALFFGMLWVPSSAMPGTLARTRKSGADKPESKQNTNPPPPASAKETASTQGDPGQQEAAATPRLATRIFEVKYGNTATLAAILSGLKSTSQWAAVSHFTDSKIITVRDLPENLATMEATLQRLDKPVPPQPNIEFHIHILIASNSPAPQGSGEYPSEIADIIKQLKATLKYKSYNLVASDIQRAQAGTRGLNNGGTIGIVVDNAGKISWETEAPGRPSTATYGYSISPISIESNATGPSSVQIGAFTFNLRAPGTSADFRNSLTLRDGDRVVVGTTTVSDGAVVVVLMAKILN